MKTRYLSLFILLTALGLGFFYYQEKINNATQTVPSEEVISHTIPEDFLPFYNQFHEDSLFQIAHTNFPLKGIMVTEKTGGGVHHYYNVEDWIIHKPFDDMGGTFTRTFDTFGTMVAETIIANGGQFKSIRRFAKLNGEWNLIYYQPMGMY